MANCKKSTIGRGVLSFVAALTFFINACVEIEIDMPTPQGQVRQPIYVIDSSKTEFAFDSAFVLNQRIVDSSSVMVDARSNVENNGGSNTTNVLGGGNGNDNGNGSNGNGDTPLSMASNCLEVNGGILITVTDPKQVKFLFRESSDHWNLIPSKIEDFDREDLDALSIVPIGFEHNEEELQYPISYKGNYLHGKESTDYMLKISTTTFEVVPRDKLSTANADTYITGISPAYKGKSDIKRYRTMVGVTRDGKLLVLCAQKLMQDAYELLVAYGAIPSQILIIAEQDKMPYAHAFYNGGYIENYSSTALVYLHIDK